MTIHDLIGVPFPVTHPVFSEDRALINKISKLESSVELKNDFEDLEESMGILKKLIEGENNESFFKEFGLGGILLPEMALSYIVVLYAKSFTEGTGRTQLRGEVGNIFEDDIEIHESVMSLRNGFYAHHGIEANRHQVFVHRNKPEHGKVKIVPNSGKTRILMSKSFDLNRLYFCISKVNDYLDSRISSLCHNIENSLTCDQLDVVNNMPREELYREHWSESPKNRVSAFKKRNTHNKSN